jgi:transposase
VDAQSVYQSAQGVVPAATSGFDPHKKVNGRKRHLLVDTLGLLIAVAVTRPAPGRVGAAAVLKRALRPGRRRLVLISADKAYNGDWGQRAQRDLGITIEVVAHAAPPSSHREKFSSRCIPSGDASPANSARLQEFFRSACNSRPRTYARPRPAPERSREYRQPA